VVDGGRSAGAFEGDAREHAARIHAERRARLETVEDIALFHQAVRPEVTFVLGFHSPGRLVDYRRAADC
jgi:hypothetical protein